MSQQSISAWIRHPASIFLIILIVIMFVVMSEDSRQKPADTITMKNLPTFAIQPQGQLVTANEPAGTGAPSQKMGNDLPKMVRQINAPGAVANINAGKLQAPDLSSLLKPLENKVNAEPLNISNRLLLAQTYNELGLVDKALKEVRIAREQKPEHARAQLTLASILSKRKNERELTEAITLLNGLQSSTEIKQYLVSMYIGDASVRLGKNADARANWNEALIAMPVADNRRKIIEKRLAKLAEK